MSDIIHLKNKPWNAFHELKPVALKKRGKACK